MQPPSQFVLPTYTMYATESSIYIMISKYIPIIPLVNGHSMLLLFLEGYSSVKKCVSRRGDEAWIFPLYAFPEEVIIIQVGNMGKWQPAMKMINRKKPSCLMRRSFSLCWMQSILKAEKILSCKCRIHGSTPDLSMARRPSKIPRFSM